jgi:hypothetical protein
MQAHVGSHCRFCLPQRGAAQRKRQSLAELAATIGEATNYCFQRDAKRTDSASRAERRVGHKTLNNSEKHLLFAGN